MTKPATFSDYLKAWPFYILPHHALSRVIYRLTRVKSPYVPAVIRQFAQRFKVNLTEAEQPDPSSYPTFNAFFTRALKAGARQWPHEPNVLASPVDGTVSQFGPIQEGRIIQAKGHDYSVLELLGGAEEAAQWFAQGEFATLYLSPRDYHRIHMPLDGELIEQIYVPGRLFSVAEHTVRTVPRVFARNERVVALFQTAYGKLAMVLVGAMNVAAIETVWAGLVTPPPHKEVIHATYSDVRLKQGEEMGRFNMGSTVILLLERLDWQWDASMQLEVAVRLGQVLARLTQPNALNT